MTEQPFRHIIVRRVWRLRDCAGKYDIYVDRYRLGGVVFGASKPIKVSVGAHQITCSMMPGLSSPTLNFVVTDHDLMFEVEAAEGRQRIAYDRVPPNDKYLQLRQLDQRPD